MLAEEQSLMVSQNSIVSCFLGSALAYVDILWRGDTFHIWEVLTKQL